MSMTVTKAEVLKAVEDLSSSQKISLEEFIERVIKVSKARPDLKRGETPLQGSVTRYDRPTDPLVDSDDQS